MDPERSAFFGYFSALQRGQDCATEGACAVSRIEGIGRPRVEASFVPGCIDAMARVPDALSLAAMRYVSRRLARTVGGSTGTNLVGVLMAAQLMREQEVRGSIVTLICDGGERYAHSYYRREWYARQGMGIDVPDQEFAAGLAGDPLAGVACVAARESQPADDEVAANPD